MTDYNSLQEKLTPAAQEVLDELVADYKIQLLKSAGKSAADITGEIREISVRDILETLQQIESQKGSKKTLLRSSYLSYGFAGLGIILLSISPDIFISAINPSDVLFWAAVFGMALSAGGFSLYILDLQGKLKTGPLFSTVDNTSKDYSMMFVMKWREIEILSKEVVANFIGESQVDNIPLRDLVRYLSRFEVFGIDDAKIFFELLEKRNTVVHSTTVNMTRNEYTELEAKLESIRRKLLTAPKNEFTNRLNE